MKTEGMVRHLVSASSSRFIASALFEKDVYVWSTDSCLLVSAIKTVMDFGGTRLAISASGSHLFAGSYDRQMICCYDSSGGREVWRHPKMGKIQELFFDSDSNGLVCGTEGPKSFDVDARDGTILRRYERTNWLKSHLGSGSKLLVGKPLRLLRSDNTVIEIANETFAVLAIEFGECTFTFSESGGHLRCHSIDDARELWRYKPIPGRHVLDLTFIKSHGKFYAIEWHYEGPPGEKYLLKIDELTGYAEVIKRFDFLPAYTISPYDALLYTHEGQGLDVRTGELVKQLPFKEFIRAS